MIEPIQNVRVDRFESGSVPGQREDLVVVEEPLEIRVQGRNIAVTMRTPGHDEALAAGFLLSEGIIRERSDIIEIGPCRQSSSQNVLNVFLAPNVTVDLEKLTRHVFASSSCGVCGKASIEALQHLFPPIVLDDIISARTLLSLPAKLREAQEVFAKTGGLHGAGLFTLDGKLLALREDVGRHNAVDKLIGHAWLESWGPLNRHILLLSGRASFEIAQKALAAGIPVIAAISAPSSLAVEFARDNGQTLVGFLRETSFNVYAHGQRVSA